MSFWWIRSTSTPQKVTTLSVYFIHCTWYTWKKLYALKLQFFYSCFILYAILLTSASVLEESKRFAGAIHSSYYLKTSRIFLTAWCFTGSSRGRLGIGSKCRRPGFQRGSLPLVFKSRKPPLLLTRRMRPRVLQEMCEEQSGPESALWHPQRWRLAVFYLWPFSSKAFADGMKLSVEGSTKRSWDFNRPKRKSFTYSIYRRNI